jgi:hypothetical protein
MLLSFCEQPADLVTDASLEQSAKLFSSHYGTWGNNPFNLLFGSPVRMALAKMKKELLFNDGCYLVQARTADDIVVGHAFVCRFDVPAKVRMIAEPSTHTVSTHL